MLASVARQAPAVGASTVVVTSDRDAFGLIDANTRVLRIINGGVEASPLLTAERLVTLLGVRPDQYRDFAALRGDPSDNLPGVRGIGPKTAARLLAAFGNALAAFDDLAAVAEAWARGGGAVGRAGRPGHMGAELPGHGDARGRGRRPVWRRRCAPAAVHRGKTTYGSLELPWTAATALRVLAGDLSVASPPAPVEPDWNPPRRRGRSLPPLRKRPAVDQLALF